MMDEAAKGAIQEVKEAAEKLTENVSKVIVGKAEIDGKTAVGSAYARPSGPPFALRLAKRRTPARHPGGDEIDTTGVARRPSPSRS